MSRKTTLAIERIADDTKFAAAFRADPARTLRRYRLDTDEIDAIKRGDLEALSSVGLDVVAFERGRRHGWRPMCRRVVVAVATVGACLGLTASPAAADVSCGQRCARLSVRASGARASLRTSLRKSPRYGVRAQLSPRMDPVVCRGTCAGRHGAPFSIGD